MGRVAREINWINILTDNEHEKAQDAIQGTVFLSLLYRINQNNYEIKGIV